MKTFLRTDRKSLERRERFAGIDEAGDLEESGREGRGGGGEFGGY